MHRKALCLAALWLAALAALPGDVSGQQKNQKNKPQQASPQDYYLISNQSSIPGQLLAFDDVSHTMSVRVDYFEWVPNPKYKPNAGAQHNLIRDYNHLMQEQSRLAGSRNARQAQQHYINMMNLQNRIAQDMARANSFNPNNPPFIRKDHIKDFDLDVQEKVIYRKMYLPEEYDDTGNLKTLSKEEKDKLRGENPNPKGSYSATASEFHPGQDVWVYLTPPSKYSSSGSSAASSSTGKDKDAEDKDVKDTKPPQPTVRKLVIVKDGTLVPTQNDQKKKKKN
jgi:hypothetical protein